MSVPIQIQGNIINFPSSGQDPNWSEGVIAFAQAVEAALATLVGPFDVPPQVFVLTSNANSNVSLPNLSFPSSDVKGAIIEYAVVRTTTTANVTETGSLIINFNTNNPVTNKWEISRDYIGDADITFSVTDSGQIQFSTTVISGVDHVGTITYRATAILLS